LLHRESNPMSGGAMNPTTSSRRASAGFTLIELLTVIAIIGILAAIIIPTVGRVRESARAANSTSNVRQTATVLLLYANDHKNRLPPGWNDPDNVPQQVWQDKVAPYVGLAAGQMRVSPVNVLNSPYQQITNPGPNWWTNGRSFGLNVYAYDPHTSNRWKRNMTAVRDVSRILLVGDMVQAENDFVGPPTGTNPNSARRPAFRHGGGRIAHFAFCDASVRGLTTAELELNPTSGSSLWRWW
jgi:prepilin-type N-terminal cleavage/methylation domain-containing protein/prepilin-type processing-associated H-X9-DG protein